jgi:hypothetical protein
LGIAGLDPGDPSRRATSREARIQTNAVNPARAVI